MDDQQIVNLYWKRSEHAITETSKKYGGYCYQIAYNILANREDTEETVNDTYLAAWNSLPPHRPKALGVFLGKITRNLSISRWRKRGAAKRGGGELTLALEELADSLSGGQDPEADLLRKDAMASLSAFLDGLPRDERHVFLRRYWCFDPVSEIAKDFGFSESKTKSMLRRTRGKLRAWMEQEAFV